MEFDPINMYISDLKEITSDITKEDINKTFAELFKNELEFWKKFKTSKESKRVLHDFFTHLADSPGQMKLSRNFFRGHGTEGYKALMMAQRTHNMQHIQNMHPNIQFCKFVLDSLNIPNKYLQKRFDNIIKNRDIIIIKLLSLSLNKAKLHYRNLPKYLDFNDLVQASNEGLIQAVDHYISYEGASFHQVAIGRILAALIVNYTNTSIISIGAHSIKKQYRINKLLEKHPNLTAEEISNILNIAAGDIVDLINTSKVRSIYDPAFKSSSEGPTGGQFKMVSDYLLPKDNEEIPTPESITIDNDIKEKLYEFYETELSIIERKVLILKGVINVY